MQIIYLLSMQDIHKVLCFGVEEMISHEWELADSVSRWFVLSVSIGTNIKTAMGEVHWGTLEVKWIFSLQFMPFFI